MKVNRPQKKHVRYGMITGIRKEQAEHYKQLHAAAWPKVLQMIKECNIQNYTIYLREIEGKFYLFSYFEYTGHALDVDMNKMAADPLTQDWWKETAPMQIPLPEAVAKNQVWCMMEEVFHLD